MIDSKLHGDCNDYMYRTITRGIGLVKENHERSSHAATDFLNLVIDP